MQFVNDAIDWLLSVTQLDGFQIILLTLPLAIIQNFLGCFPFATLILLHISALGIVNGLIISWLVSIVASLVVYFCCRYWFAEWFDRKMSRFETKYEKWKKYFQLYGVWTIILMRTLPIMPNNVIAFLSSISSIRPHAYLISSIIGNLSHIWLFGIISSSIVFPDTDIRVLLGAYLVFFALMTVAFFVYLRMNKTAGSRA
ncbi:VTT domain-containing protein [Cohnella lubricantis]|uniref:TVP38/TMEM64 family membrane protein n=1 Tax=Cohnella lubricantis TaxID=2163172 RepID=A0A841TB55_9BACL|nr:VTT domain-containing protein [Cohnella lubricantis]MBB6676618.1 VTT domain-containing protein [Cohnella lubricantis]